MNFQILDKKQLNILSKLKDFKKDFYLAGGTAIALHFGHRKSIYLDFFSEKEFNNKIIAKKLRKIGEISRVLIDEKSEYTVIVSGVKLTFLHYPFKVSSIIEQDYFRTLDAVSLAALKAYALGRRAKWKDYVDLYFVFQDYSISDVVEEAKKIFSQYFNTKNFYQQLSYFADIDYSEKVYYMKGFEIEEKVIKKYLKKISLQV
jgi:hypothetical protein